MAEVAQMKPKVNGEAKERPVAQKGGGRWKTRELAKNHFVYLADDDVTKDDLMRPGFFNLMARELRARDDIEVHTLSNRKRWLLQVIDAGMRVAQVQVLAEYDIPQASLEERDELDGFELHKDGARGWWYAIRKVDRAELGRQHQLPNKKALIRFIEDHASVRQR